MTRILLLMVALALTACASAPPPTPVAAAGSSRVIGVATIAWGPWSTEISPVATRLEMSARLATVRLQTKTISTYRAAAVLRHIDAGRDAIKIARQGNESPGDIHRAALATAKAEADAAANLLTEAD